MSGDVQVIQADREAARQSHEAGIENLLNPNGEPGLDLLARDFARHRIQAEASAHKRGRAEGASYAAAICGNIADANSESPDRNEVALECQAAIRSLSQKEKG